MRVLMSKYPEVQTVVSQHGRPDDGTDATGFFNAEFFVPLEAVRDVAGGHRQGKAHAGHDGRAAAAVSGRGVQFLAVHPGQRRGGGVRASRARIPSRCTATIWRRWRRRPTQLPRCWPKCRASPISPCCARWASRPSASTSIGCGRRATAWRPGDVNAVVQTAIGGQSAGDFYEGTSDRHFPMMVRLAQPLSAESRCHSAHSGRRAPPARGSGAHPGAARGCGRRAIWCPARRSSIASSSSATCPSSSACAAAIWAAPCSRRSAPSMPRCSLPGGYRLEWVGEFGNLQEAIARLSVAVPLSIALDRAPAVLEFRQLARCAARRERDSHGACWAAFSPCG